MQADRLVLFQAIGKGAGGVATSQITSIVVYKAAGPRSYGGAHRLQDGERG